MTLKLRLHRKKPTNASSSSTIHPSGIDVLSPKSTDTFLMSPTKVVENELFSPTSAQNIASPKLADDPLSPTCMDPLMSIQSIDPLMSMRSMDPLLTFRTMDPLMMSTSDVLIPVHMGEANMYMDRVDEQYEGATLTDLEEPTLHSILAILQEEGAQQAVGSLRAACRRLRAVVNSSTTTLKVPTSQLSALSTSSLPSRGFHNCETLVLHHTTTNTPFPATSAAMALKMLDGTAAPEVDVSAHSKTAGPGGFGKLLLTATMDNMTPPGSPTGGVLTTSWPAPPKKTSIFRRSLGVCLPCLESRAHSVEDLDFDIPETPKKSPSWFLQNLHILYNTAGLPDLHELLEACKELTVLSQFSLSMDPTADPMMAGSSDSVKATVSEAPWDLLPGSLISLKLDIPFWETALPKLKHLKGLKNLSGDAKTHFQDIGYLRCALSAPLPASLESLSSVHVTTYGDVLKVAALSRLTNLEFQSVNWDWNDPIMGGPNSYNLALNLLTALKGLETLSIRHDSQSLYADEQKLEWLLKLERLRNLELRNFKLVPRLLTPLLKQAKQLESLLLRDCVDYSSSATLDEWPALFVHPSLKDLSIEVTGLRCTGPDVHGCLMEKSIFKCFSNEFMAANASTSLQHLQLGVAKSEDAASLLGSLEHLVNLQRLTLRLQDVNFQVANVMNRLDNIPQFDLFLMPEPVLDMWNPPQPDLAGFASCLADIKRYTWREVNLPPINVVNRNSIREAVKALKALGSFNAVESLNVSLHIDWPVGRDLDTLHRSAFLAICDAITHVSSVRHLLVTIHGVVPGNVNVGTPLTLFSKLKMLREVAVLVKDAQLPPVNSMMKSAAKRLHDGGVPFVLYQPNTEAVNNNSFGVQYGNPYGLNTISNFDTNRAFMRAALMTC